MVNWILNTRMTACININIAVPDTRIGRVEALPSCFIKEKVNPLHINRTQGDYNIPGPPPVSAQSRDYGNNTDDNQVDPDNIGNNAGPDNDYDTDNNGQDTADEPAHKSHTVPPYDCFNHIITNA